MKVSWNWVGDFVDIDGIDPFDLADRFTCRVAELEGVERMGRGLGKFVTCRVTAVHPHPNADRLKVASVDLGNGVARVVSGAPNLREGLVGVVGLPGMALPGGDRIQARDIRGVRSEGMLLSAAELGLLPDAAGLLELPQETPPGAPLPHVLPVEDVVFEIDNKSITHRPDLWGHLGVARELAAIYGRKLRKPEAEFPQGSELELQIELEDPAGCPRYMAAGFTGVTVRPSPFERAYRLHCVGVRPINNVVDISNYVMLALGEPTHAFDLRMVQNKTIRVRRARQGERLVTLDGTTVELTPEDLVIADAERPVALAGVMGGLESGIAQDTTDVVVECATFAPSMIRKTSLRHGIRTDSSSRFEKGLDPCLPPLAVAMFSRMLLRDCPNARSASKVYDAGKVDDGSSRVVELDPGYVSQRLGIDVERERIVHILSSLEFGVEEGPHRRFLVRVPSFRATGDISIPEDLVEEIGRVIGYENVPPVPPIGEVRLAHRRPMVALQRKVRKILSLGCGLDEVMTYSFFDAALLERLGMEVPQEAVALQNPIAQGLGHLRTELAPSMLAVLERNAKHFASFGLYEVGRVFRKAKTDGDLPEQPYHVGLLMYEKSARKHVERNRLQRRLKGVLEELFDWLAIARDSVEFVPADRPWAPYHHPRRISKILLDGECIGFLTAVHPGCMKALDAIGAAVLAEVDLESVLRAPKRERTMQPVPRFPPVVVDLSFVVADRPSFADLLEVMWTGGGSHLRHVELVDEYEGPPIPGGKRSLTYRMTFQSVERTLTDEEVRNTVNQVVARCEAMGARLRKGQDV